jgi:hypothetical protein
VRVKSVTEENRLCRDGWGWNGRQQDVERAWVGEPVFLAYARCGISEEETEHNLLVITPI